MKLFVHIPKNGGMTIRKGMALFPGEIIVGNGSNLKSPQYVSELRATMDADGEHHGKEHARWRDWREDLRQKHRAFALVRNPWDRAVSRYTFKQFAVLNKRGSYKNYPDGSFREFLEERHEWGGKPFYWHRAIRGWYQQKDYVTDENGALRCDVLRFASGDVQDYLGHRYPVRNISNGKTKDGYTVTGKRDYRTLYGPEEHDIIADWYAEDIEFFGFTFDGPATRNLWTPES